MRVERIRAGGTEMARESAETARWQSGLTQDKELLDGETACIGHVEAVSEDTHGDIVQALE
jgi:hypothetical protein